MTGPQARTIRLPPRPSAYSEPPAAFAGTVRQSTEAGAHSGAITIRPGANPGTFARDAGRFRFTARQPVAGAV